MSLLIHDANKRGILVVDDERHVRECFRFLLKGRGYSMVHFAEDGLDAIDKLSALGPNIYLILLDIIMPRMTGIDFFERISNTHPYPIGIIACTGYSSVETPRQFFRLGTQDVMALDFVDKPFDVKQIIDTIARSLDLVHLRRIARGSL